MAALTLKNLPDDLLRDLREAAEIDRRSLNQEAIHILGLALRGGDRETPRTSGVGAQVAAWRRLAGRWASSLDGATETKRLMKRRTRGRKIAL